MYDLTSYLLLYIHKYVDLLYTNMRGGCSFDIRFNTFSDDVRRKLPLPRDPSWAIPKEGTNLYWVAKLQGAVDRQYSFYADSCLVKNHVLL
jgi:hypothetical protein